MVARSCWTWRNRNGTWVSESEASFTDLCMLWNPDRTIGSYGWASIQNFKACTWLPDSEELKWDMCEQKYSRIPSGNFLSPDQHSWDIGICLQTVRNTSRTYFGMSSGKYSHYSDTVRNVQDIIQEKQNVSRKIFKNFRTVLRMVWKFLNTVRKLIRIPNHRPTHEFWKNLGCRPTSGGIRKTWSH